MIRAYRLGTGVRADGALRQSFYVMGRRNCTVPQEIPATLRKMLDNAAAYFVVSPPVAHWRVGLMADVQRDFVGGTYEIVVRARGFFETEQTSNCEMVDIS